MAKTDTVKYEDRIRESGIAHMRFAQLRLAADVVEAAREYAEIPDGVTLLAGPETERAAAEITVRKFASTRKLRAALAALDLEAQR